MLSYQNEEDFKYIDVGHSQLIINGKTFDVFYTDKHIYCESKDMNLDSVNIHLSLKDSVSVTELKEIIKKYTDKSFDYDLVNYNDYMDLFNTNNIESKYEHDKSKLLANHNEVTVKTDIKNIPEELYIKKSQRFDIIFQEIERLNRNMSNLYYIVCNNDNIYDLSVRFKYEGELYEKLKQCDQEYFELNFELDENMYPYVPPKVTYIKPCIDMNLIMNISKLDIWESSNWNYTITLDNLIINLGNELEKHFIKYYNSSNNESKLYNLILQFSQNMNDIPFDKIDINLDFTKIITNNNNQKKSKYWNSGTGYGTGNNGSTWNINKYIRDRNNLNKTIVSQLTEIYNEIKNVEDCNIIFNSMVNKYIFKQLYGCTILELNKNMDLYECIINIVIELYNKNPSQDFYKELYESLKDITEDINTVLSTSQDNVDERQLDVYIKITSLYDSIKSKVITETKDLYKPTDDKVLNYIQMVEQNKFGNYDFNPSHLYHGSKNRSINKKTIMRVVSELSSLKKNLPINWDTSIVFRTSKTNINFVSFIISGPKDTPYENGLFEFHAYFPDTYPKVVPKVLLKTTGNGSVRFNPNLYNCGKVCLSLLGTWSGDQGESWNPEVSTFLQVLISIQSLILVENPYFNEPGWERQMHTEAGKERSFKYNDNIRLQTIRVAMVDMIKNPPQSYETFVKEHFIQKKEEIYNTIEKWISESKSYKNDMTKYYDELKSLLN